MLAQRKALLTVRVIQNLFGAIILGTAAAGATNSCAFGQYLFSSRSEFNFLIFLGTMAVLILPLFSYFYEYKRKSLPHDAIPLVLDGVFGIFSLSGGIAAAASNVLRNVCGNEATQIGAETVCNLKCGSLEASVVFTFFLFVSLGFTFKLSLQQYIQDTRAVGSNALNYQDGSTPRDPNEIASSVI